MQHLFLTSSIGTPGVAESIRARIKTIYPELAEGLNTAFITTPVEGDDQSDLSWVDQDRSQLNNNGFITFDYTITGKNFSQINSDLKDIDVLYISGGNEFYLKEKSSESNFGHFVKEYTQAGGLYIGTSAGSIIAGHDTTALQQPTDQSALKKPIDTIGFKLVNFTILPHWGSEWFRDRWLSRASFDSMYRESTPLIALNDYQYIEVMGNKYRLVDVREAK